MRILLASSEVHPYSKTGGLADMVGALAKSLAQAGHQVGVVTPLYRGIQERFPNLQAMDYELAVPLGAKQVRAEVRQLELSERLTVYFIHHAAFYQRAGLYQENGVDYPDNASRFIYFAKAVTHLARYLPWQPQVVHVHDWQAGLAPLLILNERMNGGWGNAPRTCVTIHNLAFQGNFPKADYALTNLPADYLNLNGLEFHGGMNCLKAGIVYADSVTTVSPRYAREITTEAYGCGLDAVLRQRQSVLTGILNGVDYAEWKTTDNPYLKHSYNARNLRGKAEAKRDLQKEFDLPLVADIPLFGNVTRLADQKGVDIQLGALEEMLATEMQFVLLGSGSPVFEKAYQALARRFPGKAGVRIGYDHALAHRIEAAADFFLMPSRFEPCGLNQMYSLRYGTIPIVRATGGLDDSVVDLNEDTDSADGIKFNRYATAALAKAIRKALVLYQTPQLLRQFRQNAMAMDFSWKRTCDQYLAVYQPALT